MAGIGTLLELLAQLEKNLQQIKDELGKYQGQSEIGLALADLVRAPHTAAMRPPPGTEEIVGGEETDDFPDCCAVGNDEEYICSGTLIAPNLVVTADHCTQITRVFLKGVDVAEAEDGETIPVIQSISHPEVDLKVLLLAFDSAVKPRRVAQESEIRSATTAMLAGFGTIDPNGLVGYGIKRKLAVEIPIMTLDCGQPTDPKRYGCLPGRELVAGHRGLQLDSCQGDSGGPLYIRDASGDYCLLGATSRGVRNSFTNCGDGGIYVRVDLCLAWIREVTGLGG